MSTEITHPIPDLIPIFPSVSHEEIYSLWLYRHGASLSVAPDSGIQCGQTPACGRYETFAHACRVCRSHRNDAAGGDQYLSLRAVWTLCAIGSADDCGKHE